MQSIKSIFVIFRSIMSIYWNVMSISVSFLSVNRVSPSQTNFLFVVYRRNAKAPVRRLMLAVITRDKQLLPHYPRSFIKQCLRPKPPSVRRQTPSEINTQMNFKLHPRMIYFASFVRKRLCAKNHFMSRPIAIRRFIHVVWVAYRVVGQLTRLFHRQGLTVLSSWLLSQWLTWIFHWTNYGTKAWRNWLILW